MKKRFLAIILCLAMCFTMLPMSVFAAEPEVVKSYHVATLYDDGTLEIFADVSNLASVPWQNERASIIKVVFTVDTPLYTRLFSDCTNLAEITLPSTVTEIPLGCFNNCTALTSIAIPDSVTSIGERAFSDCKKLSSITFGVNSQLQTIGVFAFNNCDVLESIAIPDTVTSIGGYAFNSCDTLANIVIPDSVTSISNGAFSACEALASIAIPDSVTSIGERAFYDCDALASIRIPASVTSIGEDTFYSCGKLTDIYYDGTVESWNSITKGAGAIPDGVTIHTTAPDLIITGGTEGADYTYENGVLEIKKAGTYEIKNADSTTATSDIIKVSAPEGTVNITLGGVNIVTTEGMSVPAFEILDDCTTNITLADNTKNILNSYESKEGNLRYYAGLQNGEHPLTISCEHSEEAEHSCDNTCGSLEAVGGNHAACIGGGYNMHGNNITISGGNIVTIPQGNGAGIGGGKGGNGNNITISNGNVTATSTNGAGIGGGEGGNGSNITISGGIVIATGQDAGIGGDDQGSCSNVTISGGVLTATSTNGVGIGGGANGGIAENIKIAPAANKEIEVNTGANVSEAEELTYVFAKETDITELVSGNAYFHSETTEHNHADTNKDHVCDNDCAEFIGTCGDVDKDHDCDYGCNKYYGTHGDTNLDHNCDYGCAESIGTHEDSNTDTDHLCDYGCGATLENCTDAENDNNHSCDICGKADVSTHTYGDAACEAPATCSECGATTGDALGHKDENRDHTCDRGCGKTDMGTHGDTDTDHACDYGCAVAIGTHAAATGKHTCDYCGSVMSSCKDDDENHICDICGAELTHDYSTEWKSDGTNHWHECSCGAKSGEAAHNGGSATCIEKAKCTACGTAYGELAGHSFSADWTYDENNHWHAATCGHEVVSDMVEHSYGNDRTCGLCGYRKPAPYIPSDPTYRPFVDCGENGDVTVTPRNPERGDTVTITADPDKGYEVDEVIVTDRNGDPVTVTDKGDGTYRFKQPYGKVTITVTFAEIDVTCPGDKTCPMYGYTDLDMTAWYHDGVHFCIENGLMDSTSTDELIFAPGDTTTRAMIVTILWRLEGQPVVNYLMQFEDTPANTWYTEAVRWAASEKLVEGYGDTFGPNDPITREQFATILWRYAKYKGYDVSVGEDTNILSYEDAFDISEWAIPAMQWACGAGIIGGKPGNLLDPQGGATRAEAATMLMRFHNK